MVFFFKWRAYIIEKPMEETKTIASDELLMDQLQSLNWEDVWISLIGRSIYILKKRFGVKWNREKLQDFSRQVITEVIDKIFLSKERKWNIDRYPEFVEFITGAVDSHIYNTLKKKTNDVHFDHEFEFDKISEFQSSVQDKISSDELRTQIYTDLQNAGATDDELLIFECLADGIDKPQELRKELGITEKDFHNLWRKFNRRREIIRKKIFRIWLLRKKIR
jgi:hypothetical protein